MSEFEEDVYVEEENPILHLELEDGSILDCAVISLFEVDGQDYIALVSIEDLESDEEESALLIYRYITSPDDEDSFSLDNIDSDEEYQMVTDALDAILDEEDEEA
ncbi:MULTISPECIES: DUF1292 domain-containing protein [Anaerostipes]|uniref:DUF1292 domain-containing protein n=1 Tax=Anaerostipes TaxID=207244 RepID=UPI000951453F|nr:MULTISPECIES: DUF1292 domain-containing protein [Anaerostipes]MCI5623795.1 DUF1292 domain-containing protein [Anaerostipes sp.]MDY2726692.1 DUF1292 domain-containing protein [Anaerostipes faecalis]OLR58773.1 hypothetical protein BHF70_03560 [Anaerostipes sp. 494a]